MVFTNETKEKKSIGPFDYLSSINDTKVNLMEDDQDEKSYNAFLINRGLSQFHDTVLIANEMNMMPHLDGRMAYDFLRLMVRKRKRFGKWTKAEKIKGIDAIKLAYGYSDQRAMEIIDILSEDQIAKLHRYTSVGGKKR